MEQQARWREQGHGIRVNVRIAGRNVSDRQLARAVSRLLERWSVPPAALSITVDENTTLSGDAPVLRALAEAGVGVGLDGYGSDSASLVRFRGLPFTELRLDRTLVAAAGREGVEAAAVRDVVDLAHALKLTVVATGVDDEGARASHPAPRLRRGAGPALGGTRPRRRGDPTAPTPGPPVALPGARQVPTRILLPAAGRARRDRLSAPAQRWLSGSPARPPEPRKGWREERCVTTNRRAS